MDNLNAAQSPEQVNQAIHQMATLMQGKIAAQQYEYEQAMGRGAHPLAMMKPGTQDILDKLATRANPPKQPGANSTAAQPNGQQPAAPSRPTKVINGKTYFQENGKWWSE